MAGKAKPKWGAGTLEAMGRQGFKEIRAALYPDSNVAREAEMGTYGTLTPGEVAEQKSHEAIDGADANNKHAPEAQPSILDQRMSEMQKVPEIKEPEREAPELDRD